MQSVLIITSEKVNQLSNEGILGPFVDVNEQLY